VLFSSDIFGSYDTDWNLYSSIFEKCAFCTPESICPETNRECQIVGVMDFHRRIMTSTKALKYALAQIEDLDISMIAPQHGSIFDSSLSCKTVKERLKLLTGVGIDHILTEEGV
jgi:flavorubredoxin